MRAVATLHNRAIEAGIAASIIAKPKSGKRRHSSLGSTFAPSKVLILNGIRMSHGQALQYIAAREV